METRYGCISIIYNYQLQLQMRFCNFFQVTFNRSFVMDTNAACASPHESDEAPSGELESTSERAPSASSQTRTALEARSTIRDMARDFGVSIRALRFYEDRGLLRPKREGATRLYDANERRNLKMILKGKQLGFTLAEIHEMLRSKSGALHAIERQDGDNIPDLDDGNLELPLPPEQILAQIGYLERQRKELDAAIIALRSAHRRLLEAPCRAAIG